MKRLFILILAIFLMAGVANAAPGYNLSPGVGDILGQGKQQSDPHKIFRMVRYRQPSHAGAATLAADSIVIWDQTDTYADDGVTVTTTTTSYDSAVAGIIVQQALTQETETNTAALDRGKRNWTWLQTYGKSQVDILSTAIVGTSGMAMATGSTAALAVPFIPGSTAVTQGNAGFFFDTATIGETNVNCFIRLD